MIIRICLILLVKINLMRPGDTASGFHGPPDLLRSPYRSSLWCSRHRRREDICRRGSISQPKIPVDPSELPVPRKRPRYIGWPVPRYRSCIERGSFRSLVLFVDRKSKAVKYNWQGATQYRTKKRDEKVITRKSKEEGKGHCHRRHSNIFVQDRVIGVTWRWIDEFYDSLLVKMKRMLPWILHMSNVAFGYHVYYTYHHWQIGQRFSGFRNVCTP